MFDIPGNSTAQKGEFETRKNTAQYKQKQTSKYIALEHKEIRISKVAFLREVVKPPVLLGIIV